MSNQQSLKSNETEYQQPGYDYNFINGRATEEVDTFVHVVWNVNKERGTDKGKNTRLGYDLEQTGGYTENWVMN
jgi:hypothetical protein